MMLKQVAPSLAIAAGLLGMAAALRYGAGAGYVSDEFARRAMQVLTGLVLAYFGNAMPKENGTWAGSPRAAAVALTVRRVGGWAMWLAGVGYAALWAFAPMDVAKPASVVIVATAMVVTVSYAARAFLLCRRARSGPPAAA